MKLRRVTTVLGLDELGIFARDGGFETVWGVAKKGGFLRRGTGLKSLDFTKFFVWLRLRLQ
ncbi:hypothetical protein EDD73_1269 [Heliophilum fasciatum]|uniref:Uncharacterized protein n=1 Tax=Heliophilum fasciatum TaxID=35700 RepID=A0A4R2RGN7_9FIRM|nr:hypothetical protein EDD73_1269 [Heliophilum fasciatum]